MILKILGEEVKNPRSTVPLRVVALRAEIPSDRMLTELGHLEEDGLIEMHFKSPNNRFSFEMVNCKLTREGELAVNEHEKGRTPA